MIPQSSINAFVKKPRRDLRKYKTFSQAEIEILYKNLPIRPPIWGKLKLHQKVMVYLGAKYGRLACLADTGAGKTITSIALIKYFQQLGEVRSALVLVPNKINKFEWLREIEKHNPSATRTALVGSSVHKWKQFNEGPVLITVETYGGLARMVCDLKLVKNKRKKTEKPKLVPNKRLVNQLLKRFDALVMDESTECQDKGTLFYRICRQISKQEKTKLVLALTGTPFGRDPTGIWSQMYLVDQGEALGETLGLFRGAFFNEVPNYWSGYPDYKFDKKKAPLLHRLLAHSAIRYEANEADLPAVSEIPLYVSLPTDAKSYYERAKQVLINAHGNFIETKNAFVRLRQISSGFLGYRDDETGAKAKFVFSQNPKLEQLMALLATITPNHKAVVFHDFIFSGDVICKALTEAKIGHVALYGRRGKSEKEQATLLQRFDNDEKVRVFVMNSSGMLGLNLQTAKYGIFYESPVPVIDRKQARRRVERQYSTHDRVFIYDLIVRDTMDQQILDWHQQGKELFQAIVDGKAEI